MPLIDLEKLLEPVSEAEPTGKNLEYEPEFAALERAAAGKPERQMGTSVVPGEPPDFEAVYNGASSMLAQSKDLRLAVRLCRALLERASFAGFAEGLALIRGLLERYWANLHPQLDPEDDNDPTMRISAVASLAAPDTLAAVKAAPFLKSRACGPVSLRELAIAAGELPQPTEGTQIDSGLIEAAFRELDLPALQSLADVLQLTRDHLTAIEGVFQAATSVGAPDFSALARLLHQANSTVRARLAQRRAEEPSAVEGGLAGGLSGSSGLGSGAVRSREDVVELLDRICNYYARCEPSSPLPLLLRRCRRLATLGFVEIMKDLAPDALSQVQLIAGKDEVPS